jgi:hypothetical protein
VRATSSPTAPEPTARFLARVDPRRTPSLFHWRYSDRLAVGLAWVGIALATSAVTGLSQRVGTLATVTMFALGAPRCWSPDRGLTTAVTTSQVPIPEPV